MMLKGASSQAPKNVKFANKEGKGRGSENKKGPHPNVK